MLCRWDEFGGAQFTEQGQVHNTLETSWMLFLAFRAAWVWRGGEGWVP